MGLYTKGAISFLLVVLATSAAMSVAKQIRPAEVTEKKLPRTADGRPDLQGFWQVRNRAGYDLEDHHARLGLLAGRGVVEGGAIPYKPEAAKKKMQNFNNRQTEDPLVN